MYKPGKIDENADALSRIKINHSKECSKFANILASNENKSDSEKTESADEQEITIEEINNEFMNFVELYKNKSLIEYSTMHK